MRGRPALLLLSLLASSLLEIVARHFADCLTECVKVSGGRGLEATRGVTPWQVPRRRRAGSYKAVRMFIKLQRREE
eukprot:152257-Hanusia_phi.AAC.1